VAVQTNPIGRFNINNTPFNSFDGFDLGKIEKILISGSKTLSDKVLIIKYDNTNNKYYLVPQGIKTVHGQTSTEIIIGVNDYNYNKNFVFSGKTETDNDSILYSATINISVKSQAMLSLKGQLLAKHIDTSDSYEQFIFSTGRNINYEGSISSYTLARNVYDTFIYTYDTNGLIALNNGMQYITNTLTGSDKQYLEPSFSTIGHKFEWLEKSLLPYIEFIKVSTGVYTLNIKCNPILNTTKNINWFGNFELIIAT
jgi:hypothetical protein